MDEGPNADQEGKTFEVVEHNGATLAMILRAGFRASGIQFFTPNEFSQQLAYMNRARGYSIPPHVHNPVPRNVLYTNEVLLIKSGRVRVDFFDDHREYLHSRIVSAGDVLLLVGGGHGFFMLEDSEMIEIKQGPYAGDNDKTRFDGVSPERLVFEGGHDAVE
jgi:hypothetical protein